MKSAEIWTQIEAKKAEVRSVAEKLDAEETAELLEQWKTVNEDYDDLAKRFERAKRLEDIEQNAPPSDEQLVEKIARARNARVPQNAEAGALEAYRSDQEKARQFRAIRAEALKAWFRAGARREISEEGYKAAKRYGTHPESGDFTIKMPAGLSGQYRSRIGLPRIYGWCGDEPIIQMIEKRQMSTAPGSGGDTIPEGFVRRFEVAMLAFGGMRVASEVWRTTGEGESPWPTMDDTANEGVLVSEGNDPGDQNIATSKQTWTPKKYSSYVITANMELLQDSAFNLEAYIADAAAERVARITNRHYTVGNGTTQPGGITLAPSGLTLASNSAITADEMLQLQHAVDPAYRNAAAAGYMMHDDTLLLIRLLKDTTGNYLWSTSARDGAPNTLWGKRVIVNQHMPTVAGSAVSVVYGDLNKYKIRDHVGYRFVRSDDLLMRTDQVAFVAWFRTDGKILDAGTNPIKAATHPA